MRKARDITYWVGLLVFCFVMGLIGTRLNLDTGESIVYGILVGLSWGIAYDLIEHWKR